MHRYIRSFLGKIKAWRRRHDQSRRCLHRGGDDQPQISAGRLAAGAVMAKVPYAQYDPIRSQT